jgi:hypothetical protein
MPQVDKQLLGEILAEARRLQPDHGRHLAAIRATAVPMNAGDGEAGGGEGGDGDGSAGGGGDQGAGASGDGGKPPWGADEDFKPETAWRLIQNIRNDLDKVKGERDELKTKNKEFEDASKSDQERLAERASNAETTAKTATAEAARLRVAVKKGLTETQAKRLVGETEEDLEKDADELLADFRKDDGDGDGDGGQEPPQGRPRERLRPGAAPGAEPEKEDPASLAAEVPRGY